jgi:hypothetical protein
MNHKAGQAAAVLIVTLCISIASGALAQNKKAGQGRQESCDGVLDVVPTKALSFVRKRRPEKSGATATPASPAAQPTPATRKKTNR